MVSHSKYSSEDDLDETFYSTLRMNFRPKDDPFVVSLALLEGKLKMHCGEEFILINNDTRICKEDIGVVSPTHIVINKEMRTVSIFLVANRLMKNHGFLLQYKGTSVTKLLSGL